MGEEVSEGLNLLREQFDKGIDNKGNQLSSDQRVLMAVDIAQQEFISNHGTLRGLEYLNRARNWPSTHKTINRGYSELSLRPRLISLATIEILGSVQPPGIFAPGELEVILVSDTKRYADRLEQQKHLSLADFRDVLFARFANAIVALGGFSSKERRDEISGELQTTIASIPKRFPKGAKEVVEREQIDKLVGLFNRTRWDDLSTIQGKQLVLVDKLFRAYQGLPIEDKVDGVPDVFRKAFDD